MVTQSKVATLVPVLFMLLFSNVQSQDYDWESKRELSEKIIIEERKKIPKESFNPKAASAYVDHILGLYDKLNNGDEYDNLRVEVAEIIHDGITVAIKENYKNFASGKVEDDTVDNSLTNYESLYDIGLKAVLENQDEYIQYAARVGEKMEEVNLTLQNTFLLDLSKGDYQIHRSWLHQEDAEAFIGEIQNGSFAFAENDEVVSNIYRYYFLDQVLEALNENKATLEELILHPSCFAMLHTKDALPLNISSESINMKSEIMVDELQYSLKTSADNAPSDPDVARRSLNRLVTLKHEAFVTGVFNLRAYKPRHLNSTGSNEQAGSDTLTLIFEDGFIESIMDN